MSSDSIPVHGAHFLEFRKKPFKEFIIGQWEIIGGEVIENPSNSRILCEFCKTNTMHRRSNEELYSLPLRSYQVESYTHPEDQWKWERFVCTSKNTCWGRSRSFKRIFDVRRSDVKGKPHTKQYKFSTINNSTVLDSFFVNVSQQYGRRQGHHVTSGISTKFRRPNFFDQVLFSDQPLHDTYYIYCVIRSKDMVPHELINLPIREWPPSYQKRQYIYPSFIDLEFFRKDPNISRQPETIHDLDNHVPIASCFLNVYKGGAGMAVHSWKNLRVEDETESYKWPRSMEGNLKLGYIKQIKPYWHSEDGILGTTGPSIYIPGQNGGFGGPLTTYWNRLHDKNIYYST